ncbi:MAG: hypothetical protein ACTSVY_07725 [Candidatus Helarchaeota archaeon]
MNFLFNNFEQLILDLDQMLNYAIPIFILEIGLMFIIQWNKERKKDLDNKIILAFGLYFAILSINVLIIFLITGNEIPTQLFNIIFIITSLIWSFAGLFFCINLEHEFQSVYKTRYIFSVILFLFLLFNPATILIPFLNQFHNINTIFNACLPVIFIIYSIQNTYGETKKKLLTGLMALFLTFGSFFFIQINRFKFFNFPEFPINIVIILKFLIIIGVVFMMFSFNDSVFFLEAQWKNNLISLHVIEKKQGFNLYSKEFLGKEVKNNELFSGGISGIVKVIKNFSESDKDVDSIQVEDKFILLEHGRKVIIAMIVRKKILNARIIMKELASKFEYYFADYLMSQADLEISQFFRPMEKIVNDLIKM